MVMELEPDETHAEVLLTEIRLNGCKVNGAATLSVNRSEDPVVEGRMSRLLKSSQVRLFRSQTMNPVAWHESFLEDRVGRETWFEIVHRLSCIARIRKPTRKESWRCEPLSDRCDFCKLG